MIVVSCQRRAGPQYRNAALLFLAGDAVMHMSGSWMINNDANNITDFDWKAVPAPCGPGGCDAMPGGASLVVFADMEMPEAAAVFVDWMAQTE